MIEPSEQEISIAPADTIDAEAAAWFRRRNFWPWGESDQLEFDLWLAKSPANEIAYWRIMGAYSRTERLSALQRPSRLPQAPRRSILTFAKHAVAGVAVAAAIGAASWHYFVSPPQQSFRTPIGGRQILTFADGTTIELNTNTLLRARIDSHQRTAELIHGEAYFKVKHDSRNPFVVTVAGHKVVDLGTEFAIRTDNAKTQVSLFTGRAELEPAEGRASGRSTLLTPGDIAIAKANTVSVTRRSVADLSSTSAWRHGLLVFRYTPLRDAIAEINRYNTDKLVIADGTIANKTVYGTVPTQSIQAFVRVATSALGLRVEKQGTEYVITR
jgi:transmembrane sensor